EPVHLPRLLCRPIHLARAARRRAIRVAGRRLLGSQLGSATGRRDDAPRSLGACLSIPRGRERGRFFLSRGGADAVGPSSNKEATTTNEEKSARSRRVGRERGVCGVARLVRGAHHGRRRAPCIRSLSLPTRLTWNIQIGS